MSERSHPLVSQTVLIFIQILVFKLINESFVNLTLILLIIKKDQLDLSFFAATDKTEELSYLGSENLS